MGVCNCSMFCCTLLYVHSSIAIILMGKRELIALLNVSSWCLVVVERLFLTVPRGCLRFVIVVFPDHTHYFWSRKMINQLHFFFFKNSFRYTIRVSNGSNDDELNNRNLFLTAKLLKQGYRYHKIWKAFSKFYHRHPELIVKYNIGLKALLQQGIPEPIFHGDLVYKFKRILGKSNF